MSSKIYWYMKKYHISPLQETYLKDHTEKMKGWTKDMPRKWDNQKKTDVTMLLSD